jgi:cytochrome c-type biogenesis protein CcmH/NrfG
MNSPIRSLLLSVLLLPGAAPAAETSFSAPERDPVMERASQAGVRNDWPAAQGILRDAIQRHPSNADYHNLYAYSLRKGASPDMNLVFRHYGEALRLEPQHRGAHEYIGEAYLMVGNVAKAKEHLGALDKLCFLPCSEYTDLRKAIAEYETKQAAR